MTPPDWQMFLPYAILAGTAVASVPLAAFLRSRTLALFVACMGLAGTIIACIVVWPLHREASRRFSPSTTLRSILSVSLRYAALAPSF